MARMSRAMARAVEQVRRDTAQYDEWARDVETVFTESGEAGVVAFALDYMTMLAGAEFLKTGDRRLEFMQHFLMVCRGVLRERAAVVSSHREVG